MIVDRWITLHADEVRQRDMYRLLGQLVYRDAEKNEYQCFRVEDGQVVIPRGAWSFIPEYVTYSDRRTFPSAPVHGFTKTLDDPAIKGARAQGEALRSIQEQEQGIVIRQPGSGKTQIALAFAAQAGTNTLVLVHTKDILQQWVDYAHEAIPTMPVGVVGAGKHDVKQLTIATVQSVVDMVGNKAFWRKFGALVVDECHHAPAETWEIILNESPARYRVGLTATESRADGREALMRLLIGPVIHRLPYESQVPLRVVPVRSDFYYPYRGSFDWSRLLDHLVNDEDRNALIARVVMNQLRKGQSTLVLSRRIKHLENIRDHLELAAEFDSGWMQQVKILTGRISKSRRDKTIEEFRAGGVKVILATQLADEALDVPRLSRVVLTFPGKHDGRIIQQVGRALREHEDKTDAAIIDIQDMRVSVLRRQALARKQAYKKLKAITVKRKEARYGKDNKEVRASGERRWNVRRVISRRRA
jgi:superfamily II DNA or RNA helicase